ncbi:Pectinesterase 2 [Acorus gramineus]|uniref:Pectinesterase n=1 Tax=Acorus gramineus TaxID=55184 RepID=A0AAV9BLJ9_ACOGR|nr:Pectinesterase 2 [Acorus gramineus]
METTKNCNPSMGKIKQYIRSNKYTLVLLGSLFVCLLIVLIVIRSPKNTDNEGGGQPPPEPEWVSDSVVAADGTGNYRTVSEAVAAAPKRSKRRYIIRIKAGTYIENVKVGSEKMNIAFIGDGINRTVISSGHSFSGGWKTSSTATVVVVGNGFMAQDITFENTAGPSGEQAVALRCESDMSVFYRCSMVGYQDTLYAKRNRQFYRECDIYGTVDFIFGRASVVLQNCNLYARRPLPEQKITFTAEGRNSIDMESGIAIHNCTITAAPDLEVVKMLYSSYLGRPWREYSRTIVMQSYLDDVIDPSGWLEWNESMSAVNTVYYREFENRGPGSSTARRVTWPGYRIINNTLEASYFTVSSFIDGDEWLPSTGVPYTGGLI